jgi:hypothetical protein
MPNSTKEKLCQRPLTPSHPHIPVTVYRVTAVERVSEVAGGRWLPHAATSIERIVFSNF